MPCTVSFDMGVARPIPMLPPAWVIIESPRTEFSEGWLATHIEIFPTVPLPCTAGGVAAVRRADVFKRDCISENPALLRSRDRPEISERRIDGARVASWFVPLWLRIATVVGDCP